ncbi:putative polyketide synthase [Ustulina deusta]|nr:putative polyketide synthase [Ustulina deusta]
MPGLVTCLRTPSSPSSSSSENIAGYGDNFDITSSEYPAISYPGYAEKPLEEQLEPIAVVGMGCRLPGDVGSPSQFWDMLMNKRTGNTPKVPPSRFNIDAHYHKNNDRPGSFGVLGGYFLNENLSDFDPGLFGMTPIEAMWMDPQQRKLLEVVYEALESGGISLEAISGTRTAVFAASFTADWQQMSFKEHSFRHSLSATGVDPGIISNRISHVFNLNGPSIMCNTACSSSVYALHNACNALRNKEAEGAIVGGVNLIITVDQHMNTAKLGVLSPTSTCHTFDERANGYGRADAVGAVYLKRLSDAIRDGDPVRGVIRTSAVNSNGKVPAVGITHPNREGQADVISHAYRRGGDLDPRLTGYFECHGTGTAIGDPLEVHAVSVAMNQERQPTEEPLWIGAVKPSIGHSEAASGISALIKAILIVERGIIPPTRGLVTPNPKIKWDEWKVRVNSEPVLFPSTLPVKRVSINSFGYGGTNAHVVVEGADSLLRHDQAIKYADKNGPLKIRAPRRALQRRRPFLLPFSAHDKSTLKRNIEAHGKVVGSYNLLDLSYTLANRRSVLQSKAFTVASHATLGQVFDNTASSFNFAEHQKPPTLGFVFTGQGSQWARMGAELMEYYPSFLRSIRILDFALEDLPDAPDWSIEDVLLEDAQTSHVNEASYSQPLCTAVQIALVQLLGYWGIRPAVTVGHSSGEIGAAYAAGLISAKEAIVVAYYRGKVVQNIKKNGSMLAVGLGAEAVEQYLTDVRGKVVVGCHNSPSSVTLSGDTDALETVKTNLDAQGIFTRAVKTGKAYHSHHMAPVSEQYEKLVRAAKITASFELPTLTDAKMVSSVTNKVLPEMTILDEVYWSANLRSPVLFNQAIQTVLTEETLSHVDLLIEVGPHSAMSGPIKQIKAGLKADKLNYLPTLVRGKDCAAQLLTLAGHLFLHGYPIDMKRVTMVEESLPSSKVASASGSIIVDLPPYQWNYVKPYWAESRASREQRLPKFPRHDVLGQLVIGSSLAEPTWRNVLRARDLPWLKDHCLGNEWVFPAAGYFAMAIEAITQLNEISSQPVRIESYVIRDVAIRKALVTPDDDDGIEVTFNIRPSMHNESSSEVTWWDFSVSSIDETDTKRDHAAGSISINTCSPGKLPRQAPVFPQRASGKAWNEALRDVGFDYGPTFQDMDNIQFDGKSYEARCTTNIKQQVDESLGESRYALHPASVDSTLQLSITAIYAGRTNAMDCGVVPIQIEEVVIWPPTEQQVNAQKATAYAWVDRRGYRAFENSVQMTAEDGGMVMEITNVRTTSYEAAVPQRAQNALQDAPYGEISWELDFDSLDASDIQELPDLAQLALFKKPSSRVVELGCHYALKILSENPNTSYTILATSDEDFETFTSSVKDYLDAKVVKFVTEQDPEAQSLKPNSCDILIVSGIKPLEIATLSQLRAIPKDGACTFWDSPRVLPMLQEAGFCFVDLLLEGNSGVTLGRALSSPQNDSQASTNGAQHTVQLVYRSSPSPIVGKVKSALEALDWNITTCGITESLDSVISEHVILLADFEEPLLFTLTEEEFLAIQNIVTTSLLLWVTPGALPEFDLTSGLIRSITSEQASIDIRRLIVDVETNTTDQIVASVTRLAQEQTLNDESPEREFCVSRGKTYISRLIRNSSLNSITSSGLKAKPVHFTSEMRIAGRVSKGKVIFQQQLPNTSIKPGHVEVHVQCAALTKDGVRVIAEADYPTTFSHAIGGVVESIEPGTTSFKVGDRVIGFNPSRFDNHQQVPAAMLHKIEAEDDIKTIVSLLLPFAEALYGLKTLARLKAGENLLILNGTGASGVAAVKIAQSMNANIYIMATSEEEVEFLCGRLRLDPLNVIGARHDLPRDKLEHLATNHGIDVIFSAAYVARHTSREAWRCIAPFGRFVDAGRKDVLSRHAIDTVPVQRSASYMPFDVIEMCKARPDVLSNLASDILQMFRRQSVTAPGVVLHTNIADLNLAVSNFSSGFAATQTIIQYETPASAIPIIPAKAPLRFSPEHTYFLVGCLGGIGRSLTGWMMELGARRFTFLSRSGTDSESAAKLVRDIQARGATVQVVRGDATSKADVVRAIREVPSKYPIKGVIHAAMVLRDGLFHSMTFESWKRSVGPKVLGAMNLHSALIDTNLDFFIMTSSISGILGTPGQSNYAAANSYLDALARHRTARGMVATSLILPMVLGVGVVAENTHLEESLKSKGMYGIDEEHLLQSFEAAVSSRQLGRIPSHIVVGLDPAKLQKSLDSGMESGSFWLDDIRFSHVIHDIKISKDDATHSAGAQSILATISNSSSPQEAVAAVIEHFIAKLARMLMMSPEDFDPDNKSISDYGIDSMVGAELRSWIFKEYRFDIVFQQLLGSTFTIRKFAMQTCAAQGLSV